MSFKILEMDFEAGFGKKVVGEGDSQLGLGHDQTQPWVWATTNQFLGDFVLVWFSSFLKHDLFSNKYGQWPKFG